MHNRPSSRSFSPEIVFTAPPAYPDTTPDDPLVDALVIGTANDLQFAVGRGDRPSFSDTSEEVPVTACPLGSATDISFSSPDEVPERVTPNVSSKILKFMDIT